MKSILFFVLLTVIAGSQATAQSITVSGKVTDDENSPLPSVTVGIKGTPTATQTSRDGSYKIEVPARVSNAILVFTHVRYDRKEVKLIAGKTVYNVELVSSVKKMEEVIVIGYGTSNRKDLTGSVGSVNIGDMEKAPVATFDQALAGRIAGVQVSAGDGQPGKESEIIIRGGNSITQDNSPLFVIDGFPMESSNSNVLNPDDIASIEILKDASSTAIYGARGANGVVLITTKKGKAGKTVVTYNGWYGIQNIVKQQEMMSPYEFVRYQLELMPSNASIYLTSGKTLDSYKDVKGINWQDKVLQTAPIQSHSIALRGGSDKTKFSLSGSIANQEGVFINSGASRYQGRFQIDHGINKNVRVGISTNYTFNKIFGQITAQTYDPLTAASNSNASSYLFYSAWGYRPVSGGDDSQFQDDPFDESITNTTDLRVNPVINAQNIVNQTFMHSLYANSFLEYSFLKNFKLRIAGGITKIDSKREAFNNSKTAAGNPMTMYGALYGVNGSISSSSASSWLNENTLTYNKIFNSKHRLNVLGGFTMQENGREANGFTAVQVPNESLGVKGLDEGTPLTIVSSDTYSKLASFLARANYTFNSKYLFTASFRADGSSRFAQDKRWGYFPSGAFAWRLGDEKFIKKIKVISDAKLRVSYGITGNNRVSDFAYLSVLRQNVSSNSSNTGSGYYFNNTFVQGTVPTNVGNENLVWEKTGQFDAGLDLSFFTNQINLTVDYYHKKTNDLLLNASLPTSTGYNAAYKNIGAVSNSGIEFTLNTVNVKTKKFGWTTNFNIAFNRNKVVQLNNDQASLTTRLTEWNSNFNNSLPYIAIPGREVALYYGFVFDGLYQLSDFNQLPNGTYELKGEVPNNGDARTNIKPGYIRYKDINGDGIVNGDDQTVIGNPLPVHIGGVSNNLRYQNFDLNIFFQWSYGNDILNANRIVFEGADAKAYTNMFASYADRWRPDNASSLMPVANGYGPRVYSSKFIEDGSYLRLKTVSLGYNLPPSFLKRMKITAVRAYMAAQNLITWTNYSGMDPEVSVRNSALTPGFDWSSYPKARTVSLGLNVTF
jgi:TonB-dependent starch-binding outer membrane protein SusC